MTVTDTQESRFKGPTRDAAVLIRLTREERARLQAFALREDLRAGQLARRILNKALDTEERCPTSLDAAH